MPQKGNRGPGLTPACLPGKEASSTHTLFSHVSVSLLLPLPCSPPSLVTFEVRV